MLITFDFQICDLRLILDSLREKIYKGGSVAQEGRSRALRKILMDKERE